MPKSLIRRHSQWYEMLLFSSLLQFFIGFTVVVLLPIWLHWNYISLSLPLESVQINTLLSNTVAYSVSFYILYKFRCFPGTRTFPFIIPTLLMTWLVVFAILLFLREEFYSRPVLFWSFVLANIWAFLGYFVGIRFNQPRLALVPFGRALELADTQRAIVTVLDKTDLEGRRYDGVVADLHAEDLPNAWQQFLASCILAHIPVFHTQQLIESITGRVTIDHLSENFLGSLLPSSLFSLVKQVLEVCMVLFMVPLWLPVMLITGIVIKLESDGPMFFIQERVGQGNKDFKVYKLRSMCKDSEKDGAQFAQVKDMRITRVGHFIRKTRLDEIPQFINVLKGDMSIIGPRPEQRAFVDQFEKEIPFYSYRHVVKPGITGWAQVMHGYAASADDTRIKIEHDFYYIKHFSLWLDILIVAKTVRTILTGFGAR